MSEITKDKIDVLFEKYPLNWWSRTVYKYFSKEGNKKDIVIGERFTYLLVILFIIGFLLTAFNASRLFIMIVILSYSILLSGLVAFIFIGVFMNRKRLKKIINELNITTDEFNALIRKYY